MNVAVVVLFFVLETHLQRILLVRDSIVGNEAFGRSDSLDSLLENNLESTDDGSRVALLRLVPTVELLHQGGELGQHVVDGALGTTFGCFWLLGFWRGTGRGLLRLPSSLVLVHRLCLLLLAVPRRLLLLVVDSLVVVLAVARLLRS